MTRRRISVIAGGLVGFGISVASVWLYYIFLWETPEQYQDVGAAPLDPSGVWYAGAMMFGWMAAWTWAGAAWVNKFLEQRKMKCRKAIAN